MNMIEKIENFPYGVAEKLGYYVYRLIDPRNGLTFYVGKGKGDRVFDHEKGAIKINEIICDDEKTIFDNSKSLKMSTIREIHAENLEVIKIIHRHNMSEKEAVEVEGALIDAYSGLSNIQGGHGNGDYGIANVTQIVNRYQKEQLPDIPEKAVLIKIKNEWIDHFANEKQLTEKDDFIYETVRGNWRIGESRNEADYVFAVRYGVIIGIYKNIVWEESKEQPGRWRFTGEKAEDIWGKYADKILPSKYMKRGAANPIQYTF